MQPIEHREELPIGPGDMLVFADETGDTALGEGASPVFGFGAVVLAYEDYASIREQWRTTKVSLVGSPDARFHAAEIPRDQLQRYGAAIGRFFQTAQFRPVSATHSTKVETDARFGPYDSVIECFLSAVVGQLRHIVVDKLLFPARVVFIFEHSGKLLPNFQRVAQAVRTVTFRDDSGVEHRSPIIVGVMKKSSGEVGLEWADFVAHAAFRRSRGRAEDRKAGAKERKPGADFDAVFRRNGEAYGEWRDIDTVAAASHTCWETWGGHHWATSGIVRIDRVIGNGWWGVQAVADIRPVSRADLVRRLYR